MNILLSSVGRRGYLVKYFKEALGPDGQVWGADNSPCSPAFAYCDGTAIVPEVKNENYPQVMLQICCTNRIDVVIPLIDPELEVLAVYQKTFAEAGVMLLISPESTIQTASDKYLTWQFANSKGLAAPQTFIDTDEALAHLEAGDLKWPVVVKARKGSASINITECYDKLQLQAAFEATPDPMIGQYIYAKWRLTGQDQDSVYAAAVALQHEIADCGKRIPSMTGWGFILFGALILLTGAYYVWRRRRLVIT